MIYSVRHRTTYSYDADVAFARCVLRLTPASGAGQTVLEAGLRVTPEPARRSSRIGPFGETATTIVVETTHRDLVIEARSRVDVHPPATGLDFGAPWECVRDWAVEAADLGPEGPAAYLFPTPRTPLSAIITGYARESFAPGREIVEAATDFMRRMARDFTFDAEATDVSTSPETAFSARRGVCQDFAQIMLCGLRGLGLSARYVSGYLRTIPPPGQPRLEGADATHAWVSVWCGPDIGWRGFDPTNGVPALEDHILLAVGRDYADVAPIDGVILSPGGQSLRVEVDVIPETESRILRPDFGQRGG